MSHTDRILDTAYSRRAILAKSGLGVAALALAGIPLGLATLASEADAQAASGDPAAILSLVLKLKYFEAALYAKALATTYPTDFLADERAVLVQIAKQEVAHVATLRAALGGAAPAQPAESSYDFTGGSGNGCGPFRGAFGAPATTAPTGAAVAASNPDKQDLLKVAMLIEDLTVRACLGGLTGMFGAPGMSTLFGIQTVEARHSAAIRMLRNSYPLSPTDYIQPNLLTSANVPAWIRKAASGGVGYADRLFTATAVYTGGLTQRDFANGKATTATVDGAPVQTITMVGVYGPVTPTVTPAVPTLSEDNLVQASSQTSYVLVASESGNVGDQFFDEPMSAASVASLAANFGIA